MYEIISNILSDKKDGLIFKCFGIPHLIMIILTILLIILLYLLLNKKEESIKNKVLNILVFIPFALYILDIFLMPFAYGSFDIEKLPFHICTSSSLLCFFTRFIKPFNKFKKEAIILGLIGNFIYLIYPAGVMWYGVNVLTYRVIQTLMFHASMVIYTILALSFKDVTLSYKTCYKDLIAISILIIWALFGNICYNGLNGRFYNWFFVVQDPFNIFPREISKYFMPFVILIITFTVDMIIYGIYHLFKILFRKKAN